MSKETGDEETGKAKGAAEKVTADRAGSTKFLIKMTEQGRGAEKGLWKMPVDFYLAKVVNLIQSPFYREKKK